MGFALITIELFFGYYLEGFLGVVIDYFYYIFSLYMAIFYIWLFYDFHPIL